MPLRVRKESHSQSSRRSLTACMSNESDTSAQSGGHYRRHVVTGISLTGVSLVVAVFKSDWRSHEIRGFCDFKRIHGMNLAAAGLSGDPWLPKSSEPSLTEPWVVSDVFEWRPGSAERHPFLEMFGKYVIEVARDVEYQSATGHAPKNLELLSSWASTLGSDGAVNYTFLWLDGKNHPLGEALQKHFGKPAVFKHVGMAGASFLVMGSKTQGIALHKHGITQLALMAGSKWWFVIPPEVPTPLQPHMYHSFDELMSAPHVRRCLQHPSEVVVLPAGWLHATFDVSDWTFGLGVQQWPEDTPFVTNPGTLDDVTALAISLNDVEKLMPRLHETNLESSLLVGAASGHRDIVEMLVARGASVDSQGARGRRPQHLAASRGHCSVLDFLLGRGAGIAAADDDGFQAIHFAANGGHDDAVSVLLAHRAQLEARTLGIKMAGSTALHIATSSRKLGMVRFLIEYGAEVDAPDARGGTPLQWTAVRGDIHMAKYLLGKGASKTVLDRSGLSAADLARHFQHTELERMLA